MQFLKTMGKFFLDYKYFFLIPIALGIVGWIALVVLTEDKSIAPFVYATY